MGVEVGFASDLSVSPAMVQEFYSENWARKIALSDDTFYRWQFMQPPSNKFSDYCVVAVRDGAVLGVMGLHKREFAFSQGVCQGAELTTWVVSEAAKGAGVGARILQFIVSQFDVLIGMGITQDALPIYLRSGFRFLKSIPRFVRVIDVEKMMSISEHAPYAQKVLKLGVEAGKPPSYRPVTWSEETSAPAVQGNHFVRDLDALTWRYERHPYFNYQTFEIGDGSGTYVVLREEVTRDIRMLHVMDILGDESGYQSAIEFADYYARENGFWAIDFYSTLSSLNKYFLSAGWLSVVDDTYMSVPHLFHPLEVRTPATTSLIYWAKASFVEMCDVSRLYITKQDADLDRPTMNYLEGMQ